MKTTTTIMQKLISWQMSPLGIFIPIILIPLMMLFWIVWALIQIEALVNIHLVILTSIPFFLTALSLALPLASMTFNHMVFNFLSSNKRLKEGHIEPWNDQFFSKFGKHGFIVHKTKKGYYRLKFVWLDNK